MTALRPLHFLPGVLESLPRVVALEYVPGQVVYLHLEGGEVLPAPEAKNITLTPARYTPTVLTFRQPLPLPSPAYLLPDALRLAALDAFDFPEDARRYELTEVLP